MASKSRKTTEAEARAEAKAKAQAELKAKERRTTVIIVAASLLVIAALAGVIYFIVDSSKTPTIDEVAAPAGADETGGILVGSADGAHRADVYLDFMCPYCGHFEEINGPVLDSFSQSGDLAVYYHPLAFLDRYSSGTKYSSRSANAAAVVADRDPEHFTAFFAAMFANQPKENSTGLSDEQIAQIAVGVGVLQEVADTFKDGEFAEWVAAATQQASIDGVGGTPTFKIDRSIVEQTDVPYMTEGVLDQYLSSLFAQ
jgi:protein-disulfide isomerase